jgi:hypothetical protein
VFAFVYRRKWRSLETERLFGKRSVYSAGFEGEPEIGKAAVSSKERKTAI